MADYTQTIILGNYFEIQFVGKAHTEIVVTVNEGGVPKDFTAGDGPWTEVDLEMDLKKKDDEDGTSLAAVSCEFDDGIGGVDGKIKLEVEQVDSTAIQTAVNAGTYDGDGIFDLMGKNAAPDRKRIGHGTWRLIQGTTDD